MAGLDDHGDDLGRKIANDTGVMASAMQAAASGTGGHSLTQARKLRQQLGGNDLPQLQEDLLRYERSLRVCEPKHRWVWKPDENLSRLWHSLTPQQQQQVTEVDETHAFNEWVDRIRCCTCLVKNPLEVTKDAAIFQDISSREVFREFFLIAVSENAPLAVTIKVIEAVDNTVQDFCASRVADHPGHGPDSPFVDPRTFPVGSFNWVRYREREHTRLLCMCHMLQLFEDRLVHLYELRHGAKVAQSLEDAAAVAMAELLALDDMDKKKKAKQSGKGKKKMPAAIEGAPNSVMGSGGRAGTGVRHTDGEFSSQTGQEAAHDRATSTTQSFKSKGTSQFVGGLEDMLGDLDDDVSDAEDLFDHDLSPDGEMGGRVDVGGSATLKKKKKKKKGKKKGKGVVATGGAGSGSSVTGVDGGDSDPNAEADGSGEGDIVDGAIEACASEQSKSAKRRQRKKANKAARDVLSVAASQNDGETDEIDAEFARRVAEHIRQRREAAAGTAENVSRGTSVLKVLCAKLKSNLEEQMAAARR